MFVMKETAILDPLTENEKNYLKKNHLNLHKIKDLMKLYLYTTTYIYFEEILIVLRISEIQIY